MAPSDPTVRHRTRPRALDLRDRPRAPEPSQADLEMMQDLTEWVLQEALPDEMAERVRDLAARRSPELMPYVYDTLWKLRSAGMMWENIARRFQVHVQTIYKWRRGAVEWLKKRHTKLDPALHFSVKMQSFTTRLERLTATMMNVQTVNQDGTTSLEGVAMVAKLNQEITRVSEEERRWMETYGYFGVFTFGKVLGQDADSAEERARENAQIVNYAFGGQDEEPDLDGDDPGGADVLEDWPGDD